MNEREEIKAILFATCDAYRKLLTLELNDRRRIDVLRLYSETLNELRNHVDTECQWLMAEGGKEGVL